MAPRRKQNLIADVVELAARMPWWLSLLLAAVLYFVLHAFAARPVPAAGQPGQIGSASAIAAAHAIAGVLQYVLPSALAAGAAASIWRRRQRSQLAAEVAATTQAGALDGITWQQFEQLVSEHFRQQGFTVAETGGGGPDGGVDLVLARGSEKHLVQCKQWRAQRVGVDVVRELYGVMAAKGAAGGYVVSSGRFTADAEAFADGRNIRLVGGQQLHALVRKAHGKDPVGSRGRADGQPATPTTPPCPVCGKAMVRRMARVGSKAGGSFWGCSGYPQCRGTRTIE